MNKFTLGSFLSDYYLSYLCIIKKGNYVDKFSIIMCVLAVILLSIFIIFGCFLPKHLLIWHIFLCIIVLFMLDTNNLLFNNIINDVLKKYKNDMDNFEIIPLTNKTCKIILFISLSMSLMGYIYPNYSLNAKLRQILYKLNMIDSSNEDTINPQIATEFKINNININKEIEQLNINKKIEQFDKNDEHLINQMLDIHNFEPLQIDTKDKNISSINVKDIDSGLQIFDKIEPIKIEIKYNNPSNQSKPSNQSNPSNIVNTNINKKIIEKDVDLNLMKMREELRKFNDTIVTK